MPVTTIRSSSMKSLWNYLLPRQHAALIWQFACREVDTRYRQSWLGPLWLVITPLLILGIYTLVFRHVLQLRWGAVAESNLGFSLRLYAGLAVLNFFSDCVNRAPNLILEQAHLIKKVVFPVEILPWISVVASMVHLVIAFVLLLVLGTVNTGQFPVTALALPLVWLPLLPLCLGLSWLLSGIGTFVQDLGQVVSMALMVLLFLSPIFFPVEALPAEWRAWIWLNPLALIITQTREVLMAGHWPEWQALAVHMAASLGIAGIGAAFFRAVRPGFADVV
jgi:lipopolysaccharide transport system permease protein